MFLTFLKELPDRYILIFCFLITMCFYVFFTVDAVLQLMINFAVAIIAISKRPSPEIPSAKVENVGSVDVTVNEKQEKENE